MEGLPSPRDRYASARRRMTSAAPITKPNSTAKMKERFMGHPSWDVPANASPMVVFSHVKSGSLRPK